MPSTLLNENFAGADVVSGPWIYGTGVGSADPFLTARSGTAPSANGIPGGGTPIDPAGAGALRLTNAVNDQATFVIYNAPLAANGGLSIRFQFAAYGSTNTIGGNAADGFSFFLVDGAVSPTTVGGFGGSLGYAPGGSTPGLAGAYLGVGFDEFGNFSGTGTPVPDSIAIRGSQASGYAYLTGTGTLTPGIDNAAATTRGAALRTAQIDLTPTGLLSVQVDLNNDGDFADAGENAITAFNVAATNGALPNTFKFGFAASTGGANNIHEIRSLAIQNFSNPPVAADAAVGINPGGTSTLAGLSAADSDGTIASYTLTTIPPAAQGFLYLGDPANGGTVITAGQVLTPAQIGQLFFQATGGFTGASFTYTATDNTGATDITPATVTLGINAPGINAPPILPNPVIGVAPGSSSNLTGLSGSDTDGTIGFYIVSSLPPSSQGTLYLGNPANGGTLVTAGQILTPAQIQQIFFQAGAGFSSTSFVYTAVDNAGGRTSSTVALGIRSPGSQGSTSCADGIRRRGNRKRNALSGTSGKDRLLGLAGNDALQGRGCDDRIDGGKGHDRLFGNGGQDRLNGQRGRDRLNGGRGRDVLTGGLGRDRLSGGKGNDLLRGGRGNDFLGGGQGADRLQGGRGRDRLRGSSGNDVLQGRQDGDRLNGGGGRDRLSGGLGRDRLAGGKTSDVIKGGGGDDLLLGNMGRDRLQGQRGNDRLYGGGQADRLNGGSGDDVLIGGRKRDSLTGGLGSDRFVIRSVTERGDIITDFQVTQDVIDIRKILGKPGYDRAQPFQTYVQLTQSGANTVVNVDFNGSAAGGFKPLATLVGVIATSLSAQSFAV